MVAAFLGRLGQTAFVLFGISVLVFLVFFATPGADPTARIAGRNASPETMALIRHQYGFDRSLPVQYERMMRSLFITRDLTSFVDHGERVVPEVFRAAPVTLSLVSGAAIVWVLASVGMGTLATALRGSLVDRGLMILGLIGISMPVFWLGEVVNLITQSRMHESWMFSWVPGLGYVPLTQDPIGWFKVLVIPWVTLAILFIGIYGRILRADLVAAYSEDFMRTAQAKGLSASRVLFRHGPAHLDDHLRLAVRAGFRAARRWGRVADRSGVRPAGCRTADLPGAVQPRPAADHGDRDVLGGVRRAGERAGRYPLPVPRPADTRCQMTC